MILVVVKCIVIPLVLFSKKKAVCACMTDVAALTNGSIYLSLTEKMLKLESPEQTRNGKFCESNPGIGSIAYLF